MPAASLVLFLNKGRRVRRENIFVCVGEAGWQLQSEQLVIEHPLLPTAFAEIEIHDQTADNPTAGVGDADRINGIGQVGADEEINLSKDHEGENHDDHGRLGISDTTQGAGVDLIEGGNTVKETVEPYKESAEADHIRILVKEVNDLWSGDEFQNTNGIGNDQGKQNAGGNSLLDPFDVTGSRILTDKGGHGKRKALKRQDDKGIHPSEGTPSGGGCVAEAIDIPLDKDVRKGNNRHLCTGGKTDIENFMKNRRINFHFPKGNAVVFPGTEENNQRKRRRDKLGKIGRPGDACDPHVKIDDKNKIQNNIQKTGQDQEIQRNS